MTIQIADADVVPLLLVGVEGSEVALRYAQTVAIEVAKQLGLDAEAITVLRETYLTAQGAMDSFNVIVQDALKKPRAKKEKGDDNG